MIFYGIMNNEEWEKRFAQRIKEKRLASKEVAGYGAMVWVGGALAVLAGGFFQSQFITSIGLLGLLIGIIVLVGGVVFYYIIYKQP